MFKHIHRSVFFAFLLLSVSFGSRAATDLKIFQAFVEDGCSEVGVLPFSGAAESQCCSLGAKHLTQGLSTGKFLLSLCAPLPSGGLLRDDFRVACLRGATLLSKKTGLEDIAFSCDLEFSDGAKYRCFEEHVRNLR